MSRLRSSLPNAIRAASRVNEAAGRKRVRVVIHDGEFIIICVDDCNHTVCWPAATAYRRRRIKANRRTEIRRWFPETC